VSGPGFARLRIDAVARARIDPMAEYTFFVDADGFFLGGGELHATEDELHELGVRSVDIPAGFGVDLGERIPVRVVGTPRGLRFYAHLLGVRDPVQLEELDRVLAAASARGEDLDDLAG
jgi:hypothetical protein